MEANAYYHEFEPSGLEPMFVVVATIGLAMVVIYSWLIVRIRPIDDKCRRYHSVGRKAARISQPRRRCGSATKEQHGLAIIFPSTSSDWEVAAFYVVIITALALYYHGCGFLQILLNHGLNDGIFVFLILLVDLIVAFCVVRLERLVQFISAKMLYLSTFKETGTKMLVFEEWGLYDKICRKEFEKHFRTLSREERRIVRSVIPYEISEKIRLDRIESLMSSKEKRGTMAIQASFEPMLDSIKQQVGVK